MDRTIRWFGMVLVMAVLTVKGNAAGVSLVAVPEQPESVEDGFPISRFGAPPSNPVLHGADRPAPVSTAERSPAGLVVGESAVAALGSGGAPSREAEELDRRNPPPMASRPRAPSEMPTVELIPNKTKGIQEVALIAGDLGFFPKTFFVTRDVPVRLFVTGASRKPLCFMMDSFQVRRQVSTQKIEEVTFVPNVPGQYRFYCPMNGMEGTMVVRELGSVTAALAE